ncbi:hypothetical protein OKA04_10840 [Luteolibacter flavescens]|uniref:Uncharacterized protein n=1 Tax=Luteolibacter flavescens TaxID=1859460 RepID=A0ABT3FNS3_9BACT|nr:hypothetical protein [Luteolibacter flavescens]MCW1885225.1 hypothetical protein [Luteolibacter flavescens]
MKPIHFLPPAVALVASGIWLGMQQQSISTVEKETVLLRQHIEAAKQAAGGDRSLAEVRSGAGKAMEKDDDAIDWKNLADSIAKAERGGIPDMKAMMKIQRKLMSLSPAELTAALDEIATLEMSQNARAGLENSLINLLSQKEPELVLNRFLDRLNDTDGFGSWQLSNAFRQWTDKDGAAAAAWLDAQIAAGKFEAKSLDGKSQSRMQFEAAVISALIHSDVEAASKRLASVPEELRKDMLQHGMLASTKPGGEKNYAILVRENLPEKDQAQAFDQVAHSLVQRGGYEKVGEFLSDIDATPAERSRIVMQAASNKIQQLNHRPGIERKDVDEMRAWVAKQSPESVDTVTAESLGSVWGNDEKWESNAKIINDLHAEQPSDELLLSFLKNGQASNHREIAREMAAKISDEAKRAELMERFKEEPAQDK